LRLLENLYSFFIIDISPGMLEKVGRVSVPYRNKNAPAGRFIVVYSAISESGIVKLA
jgi:hypothetical protein